MIHTSNISKYLSIPFSKLLYDRLVWAYTTKIKWHGTDYESSRPYDSNDHSKSIDWKTTAKKDTLYTKQFHQEQQLHICLILDIGFSMQFGYSAHRKYDVLKDVSILLSSIISDHKDIISLISYDQKIKDIQLYIQWSHSIASLINILKTNSHSSQTNELFSDLSDCLIHLKSLITAPTHFIFITDDQYENTIPLLKILRRDHEISYILIQHSLELTWIDSMVVSDGKNFNYLNKDYPDYIKNKNLTREQEIHHLWWYYLHLTEQSDIQKSLLSLWR